MNYFIWTIGCQMNVADSRRLASALERVGCAQSDSIEQADVIVLNTCVVRQSAEDKVYGRLGSLRPVKRQRPDAVICLMGCLVGSGDGLALRERFPWVDVVAPPSDPGPLLDHLAQRGLVDEGRMLAEAGVSVQRATDAAGLLLPAAERGRLVSAFVPVVLGCSHACTYCIIPYRRGRERSRPPAEIVAEAQSLAAQGIRDITLLGQIVDRYGYDLAADRADVSNRTGRTPLVDLLERVHEIDTLDRVRFLTSHPNWLSDDLIAAVGRLEKVCEHIEAPVQAGSDQVLARMRRGYTVDDYRRLVARIRAQVPNVSIATDVIVGFPGETEEQFMETFGLLTELRLDRAHIARYSPRDQTFAARKYEDDVPPEEKERRRKQLDDLQAAILTEMHAKLLHTEVEVLVEGRRKGRWWGRTRNDKLVFFESDSDWTGHLVQVNITWTGPWSLIGEAIGSPQVESSKPSADGSVAGRTGA
jgi:tRNA-2-methylthio-N6-dimethylallyladenosine synthase